MSMQAPTQHQHQHQHQHDGHPLPIARYRFSARALDAVQLPHYAGSLLRGQFGAALRHLACMTRQPSCTDCPLRSTCPYTRILKPLRPSNTSYSAFPQSPTPM